MRSRYGRIHILYKYFQAVTFILSQNLIRFIHEKFAFQIRKVCSQTNFLATTQLNYIKKSQLYINYMKMKMKQ